MVLREVCEVERIIDSRYIDGKEEFLIKWKGCDEPPNSWVKKADLKCRRLITEFHETKFNQKVDIAIKIDEDMLHGFDRGLSPSHIVMVTRRGDDLYYLVKWKGRDETDVVPAARANIMCPQLVIDFYERILHLK